IGEVIEATPDHAHEALAVAAEAQRSWDERGGVARAAVLDRAADLYEANTGALVARIVREAGRTVPNALNEVREAVDFLRYYAAEARRLWAGLDMPGPTGERNTLRFGGRGVFVCISPWNFP